MSGSEWVILQRGNNTVRLRRSSIDAVRRYTAESNSSLVSAGGQDFAVDGEPEAVFEQCFPAQGDVLEGFTEAEIAEALSPHKYTVEWSGHGREARRAMAYALLIVGLRLGLAPAQGEPPVTPPAGEG